VESASIVKSSQNFTVRPLESTLTYYAMKRISVPHRRVGWALSPQLQPLAGYVTRAVSRVQRFSFEYKSLMCS
jgi:hypothetical protein